MGEGIVVPCVLHTHRIWEINIIPPVICSLRLRILNLGSDYSGTLSTLKYSSITVMPHSLGQQFRGHVTFPGTRCSILLWCLAGVNSPQTDTEASEGAL